MNNMFLLGVAMDFGKMIKWIPTFIDGMIVTVVLSLMTVFLGSIIGLVAIFLQQSQKKSLNAVANIYTQVIRGTPLLVQLYIWLYGLPLIGISLPTLPFLGDVYGSREFLTAVVALSINSGAYICELLRGGLESIDKGQMEAGRSLGLSRKETMKSVIIPQAIRVVLPGLGNEFIAMIKESSIVSVVGIFDVMYTSNIVKVATYSIFEPLIIVAIIYFFLTYSLTDIMKQLEKRLSVYD
ncbi:amino acid ABC transporter permease [Vagococcus fluvialis]|uniref:amino acid ABC transporter permease n=1 Tax=Vagococcus fluvialis TaxID=2738 RepID=UPI001A8CE257|nr:amino acid ABC transporter permease [Vagococcus fluvialis]MBO0479807.1 amino acid ABC transporter permease [Vagococcus fluvialis]MBO0483361.1 amino acid ABC transporter permease [Vagococcus fluvialis]